MLSPDEKLIAHLDKSAKKYLNPAYVVIHGTRINDNRIKTGWWLVIPEAKGYRYMWLGRNSMGAILTMDKLQKGYNDEL